MSEATGYKKGEGTDEGGNPCNFLELFEDRVLVLPDEPVGVTKGGIMLPDVAKEKPVRGTVMAVGPGRLTESFGGVGECEAKRLPMHVKSGDRVFFQVYGGGPVEFEGVVYRLMTERELIGKILRSDETGKEPTLDEMEYRKKRNTF